MNKKLTTEEKLVILQKKFGRKELTEGCLLKRIGTGRIITIKKVRIPFKRYPKFAWCDDGRDVYLDDNLKRNYEIIGHPLALNNVLAAIGGVGGTTIKIDFDDYGDFRIKIYGRDTLVEIYWDLSKIFRGQEPETIDAIYEILIPTK